MGAFQDLVGNKFGRLTVTARDLSETGRRARWRCQCSCGQFVNILGESLRSGATSSCGCLRREITAAARFKDLTGQTFGRLVVLKRSASNRTNRIDWICECSCGTTVLRTQFDLTNSREPSCGCYKLERASELGKAKRRPIDPGSRFGRLTVIAFAGSRKKQTVSECRCDCGVVKVIANTDLRAGNVISCGCAWIDKPGLRPAHVNAYQSVQQHKRRARLAEVGGSFTTAQIDSLYTKQRGRCANCSTPLHGVFHRDHRVALANGGTNDITNIELLCGPCNLRKNAKDEIAWAQQNGRLI